VTTLERIQTLFVDKLEINKDLLVPEATLEGLGIDSLDRIEFMFDLEDEFGIKIPDREVKIITINDMVETIEKLVEEQKACAQS